ncbi:imidazoleglycerol-phosphate dehydratase HisB [Alkalibaculum sp. M08DMB]|uniref:Imidazoleglycerol-phosphate dehydratase n=2 Tax=Alkalibaculum sporogenes TaxID=2655001 RepID=A0A6A7K817_9FIRM|nr:imidazoleglycerol-phosphate dehydratase HisB [Alkalibaculum sporogenes]MPW25357.1 imidazoleglycerol-phosphate dehydratase HisB [Alkalibaculum sporogenes]
MRVSTINRKTTETEISITLNLDGHGICNVDSGIGFFDHMLVLFCKHGNFDINLTCSGDLQVDNHHTIEDIGIVMGTAFNKALGTKIGIKRYGTFYCPMDEALSRICVDLSGRNYLVYDVTLLRDMVGELETDSLREFFYAFASNSQINLHINNLYGENTHHIVESIFKGLGRALREATEIIDINGEIPSTKGIL